jgi:hypothetical protein
MVLNFTFRDSKSDFINVSSWGSEEYIAELNNVLNVGSAIQIQNVRTIRVDKLSDAQKWKPWTPTEFELTLNEGSSEVLLLNSSECSEFEKIANDPIRCENDYFTLEDVILNDRQLDSVFVNLLFSVKQVELKKIKTTDFFII